MLNLLQEKYDIIIKIDIRINIEINKYYINLYFYYYKLIYLI